ncbi:putative lipid-transfer protein DIR1 [Mercurialis annua]|uniref:putative lipid-transfer protein DIR1 n=1 Tax=Mercurialis annua TaxID=3986 RepID=UPI002160FC46|nr:putative lipid-transfer protein DIR1 [Mercurialis annua]
MGCNNTLVIWIAAMLMIVMMNGVTVEGICNTSIPLMSECFSAVDGDPSTQCCLNIQDADLQCLCKYKFMLSFYTIDLQKAMQIPTKCGQSNPCT